MSVVAGCSLFDGVLLGADCRVTFRQGSRETHRDTVQKLLAITPGTAIGFVGDLTTATQLLVALLRQGRKKKLDPVSLMNWLPRLFHYHYAKLKGARPVSFMVGSVIQGRLNVVEGAAVAKLLSHIAFGNPSVKRNWIPPILIQILEVPPAHKHVGIPASSMGLLYVMHAPGFIPEFFKPLDYVAIGSGEGVVEQIHDVHDMIFAGEPGAHQIEAMWLTESMQRFTRERNIPTVGGIFTVLKVTNQGVMHIGRQTSQLPSGPAFELIFESDRWVQRNLTTGKEIELLLPWDVNPKETTEHVFDDLRFRNF